MNLYAQKGCDFLKNSRLANDTLPVHPQDEDWKPIACYKYVNFFQCHGMVGEGF